MSNRASLLEHALRLFAERGHDAVGVQEISHAAGPLTTAALILSLLLWVRNPFGMVAILLLGCTYALAAIYAPARARIILAQLTGIQLCLSALVGFDYLFTPGFVRDGQLQRSDTQAIADALLLPYWFWGVLIAAFFVTILAASFWIAWKPSRSVEPRV